MILAVCVLPLVSLAGPTFFPMVGLLAENTHSMSLMNFDNNINDAYNNTITNNGITFNNTIYKFGYSAYFDGTTNATSDLIPNFGSNNFTVECWLYISAVSVPWSGIISQWKQNNFSTSSFAIIFGNDGQTINALVGLPDDTTINIQAPSTLTIGNWHHFAFVRNGSTLTLYQNGNSIGSAAISGAISTSTYPLYIGGYQLQGSTGTSFLPSNLYVDDLRISRVARYSANFTPPASALHK